MAIQKQLVPINPAAAAGPHKSCRPRSGTFAGCAGAAQHPEVGSTTSTHGYDRAASKLGHRRGAAWASARSYVCAVSSMLIPTTCSQRGTRRLMKGKRLSPPLSRLVVPWEPAPRREGSIVDRHSFINASCMHTGRFWRLFRLNSTELSVPCSPSIMACRRGALSPRWL